MFEVPVDKQEAKSNYERVGVSIVVLLVIAGAVFYFLAIQNAKLAAPVATAPIAPADPVHNLKIIRVAMNKDPMGITAVWLVTLQNKSAA